MSQFPETVVTRNPDTHLCHYDFSAYRLMLPHEWINGLERYFNEGIETGGFLRAVLENDFQRAIRSCHLDCCVGELSVLQQLLDLLAEGAPSKAWGSKTAVDAWLLDFNGRLGVAVPRGEVT